VPGVRLSVSRASSNYRMNLTALRAAGSPARAAFISCPTQALPTARRIAILANPANPSTPAMRRDTEARAAAIGVQLLPFEASAPERLAAVLAAVAQKHPDALVVLSDPMFLFNRRLLVEAAARNRLAASGNTGGSWNPVASWRTVPCLGFSRNSRYAF
jgi:putative ABC transport system substrate-binding protein